MPRETSLKLERDFQSSLIAQIKDLFPGSIVVKLDANYIQGIPDLLVLYGTHWAALECKRGLKSTHRPNQDYYISRLNEMSFSRLISPENCKEVLHELQQAFGA